MTRTIMALLFLGAAAPALAQPKPPLDQRVDRVERELKAVQRKVFPGGAPAYSEPEIGPAASAPPPLAAGGAPLNELTSRVDALEREVGRLTGQVEQDEHRLDLVSRQAATDRAQFDARLKTLEGAGAPAAAGPMPTMGDEAGPPFTRQSAPVRAGKPAPGRPLPTRPAADADQSPALPPPADAAASSDPADQAYMAGYQLWMDKKYADAEASLKKVVAKYPKHRRASYAQNLLGRAYLDDGQPATAAEAFAANYQTNPHGERAPDSLYYLGQSLMQLKKPADACRVYAELDTAYGATLSASLKARVATARKEAKCK